MRKRLRETLAAGLLALPVLVPILARADDEHHHGDQDVARDLYERGEIRPLADILRHVRRQHPGDVVAVDLVQIDNKWVYRFQIVGPDGRRSIVDVRRRHGLGRAGRPGGRPMKVLVVEDEPRIAADVAAALKAAGMAVDIADRRRGRLVQGRHRNL